MRWEDLLFLHWEWDAVDLQARIPRGLEVDLFDGRAWLGVVPFRMRRVHPSGLFPVPWLSDFLELNVRTYVRGPDGLPGVWFFSLACNQPVATALARTLFHLNYVNAQMKFSGGLFTSERKTGGRASIAFPARVGSARAAEAGSLEEFLVERYRLFAADRRGDLYCGRVKHDPYRLYSVPVGSGGSSDFAPAVADGFCDPGRRADHTVLAEVVDVTAWPIRRVGP